jgi:hypothetical protein
VAGASAAFPEELSPLAPQPVSSSPAAAVPAVLGVFLFTVTSPDLSPDLLPVLVLAGIVIVSPSDVRRGRRRFLPWRHCDAGAAGNVRDGLLRFGIGPDTPRRARDRAVSGG